MKTVLIVEDDPDTRSALADVLTAEGYRAVAAEAVDQAVEYLSTEEAPCLILLDAGLPCASGVEVLRWLRDRGRKLPVAVMSGWHPAEKGLEGFRDHVVGVLRKPFDVNVVLELIEEQCDPSVVRSD